MVIRVNYQNLILQNNLSRTTDRLATAMARMTTGYKINSASDGAAELMLSKGLEKQISGLTVCNNNAQMASNILSTADGALSQITDMANRIRDIALSSANGIYSESERMAYQAEVNALTQEIKRQVDEARFNDYKIFNEGASPTLNIASTTSATHSAGRITREEAEAMGYTCVTTAQELKNALRTNDSSCKVMLMNDINLDDLGLDATGSNWTAVGISWDRYFAGVLDGNGYAIKNLKINATTVNQGLIGYAIGATIQNLEIKNADVTSTANNVGALAGRVANTTIKNISVSGNVEGVDYVGGVVGWLDGNIIVDNCNVSADLKGCKRIGGLAGYVHNTNITDVYVSGDIQGMSAIAGLAGEAVNCDISNVRMAGDICAEVEAAGIASLATNVNITNANVSGKISGNSYVGGLVSYALDANIEKAYVTALVTGTLAVGGLIGHAANTDVKSVYTASNISGSNISGSGNYVGGLVGDMIDNSTVSDAFVSGNVTSPGIAGNLIGKASNVTISNYSFAGEGNGIGTGVASGATDTAGKDASWFRNEENVRSVLGEGWDYSCFDSMLVFQIGTEAGVNNILKVDLSFSVKDFNIDVMSAESSRNSLEEVDKLINFVTSMQGKIGSAANVMDSVVNNNTQTQTNLTSSNSRLIDADIARESAEFVKTQIRQNMTASLLAQTSTNMSQIVLSLYGI